MHDLLIDPWLVEIRPNDSTEVRISRYSSYIHIEELRDKYSLNLTRFLSYEFAANFFESFHNDQHVYQRDDGRYLMQIIKQMILNEEFQGQEAILDGPCPDNLSSDWLKMLAIRGNDDEAPNWRRPVIVVPESRVDEWPDAPEIIYTSTDGQVRQRNLICSESYEQHQYCEPDFDPWRIGAVGTADEQIAGGVAERHESRKRLPRPPILPLTLTYDELVVELHQDIDWSIGENGKAYFIPPINWDPRLINKIQWRNGNIFESASIDGRRGPRDREGRIWLWDLGENHHWDVQLPNRTHLRVSHTGEIL